MGLGKWLKEKTGIDVTGIDLSKPIKDITGIDLDKAGKWIDKTVSNIIPGGWTTLAEVGIALTPAGALGAAAFGGLSGATGGFKKKGFDLQGAIIGGLQGYGVGSLTTSLASAGTPAANPYEVNADYNLGSATRPEAFNAPTTDFTSGANFDLASGTPPSNLSLSSSPTGLEQVNLAPPPSGSTYYSGQYTGSLAPPTAPPPGSLQTGVPTSSYVSGSPSGPYEAGTMNFPSGSEKIGLQGNLNLPPSPPSALESLGSGMADKASQAGQGIQNLVGLGPQGLSGIMPAASAVNAGMGYTAYTGLGLVALEHAAKKNQDDYDKGEITDQQYLENQRMINDSIAASNATVNQYRYEPDSAPTEEQETLYAKPRRTLYDQYAQNEPVGLNNMYASGGSVSDYETPDTLMAGGITNGFNFNSGGQMPMYKAGGTASPNASAVVTEVGQKMYEKIQQVKAEEAAAKAAAEKPMSDFRYEPVAESQSNSSPLDYQNLGALLYAQKKMGRAGYAEGGEARFLSGGGDGMSDSIKASIDGKQEARLADGEFVIPADVVSHLGNGSSKAGAKQLYAMMERVRKARTGNQKQGKQINPTKFMPA